MLCPLAYDLEWRGQPVPPLREKDWEVVSHSYPLKKLDDFAPTEERSPAAGLVAAYWQE